MAVTNTSKYEELKKVPGFVRTGSLLLDLVVGGGKGLGLPLGKMVNIVGNSSAGKTFVAMEIIANLIHIEQGEKRKKININIDDAEAGNTFNTQQLFGFPKEAYQEFTSETVEQFNGNVLRFMDSIKPEQPSVYVLDSLDSLSDEEKEKFADDFKKNADSDKKVTINSYQTGTASHLSKHFFKTAINKIENKKMLLLIISQVREKIGATMFEKKVYRAGGKAMDFYAHTCLWLYSAGKIMSADGSLQIGVHMKAVTEKSKTPRPYRTAFIPLYFSYGMDDIGSCIEYLFQLRDQKTGSISEPKKKELLWFPEGVDTEKELQKPKQTSDLFNDFVRSHEDWKKEISEYRQAKDGSKSYTMTIAKEWLELPENSAKLEQVTNHFMRVYTYAELKKFFENNTLERNHLYNKVVDLWEASEKSAAESVGYSRNKY